MISFLMGMVAGFIVCGIVSYIHIRLVYNSLYLFNRRMRNMSRHINNSIDMLVGEIQKED